MVCISTLHLPFLFTCKLVQDCSCRCFSLVFIQCVSIQMSVSSHFGMLTPNSYRVLMCIRNINKSASAFLCWYWWPKNALPSFWLYHHENGCRRCRSSPDACRLVIISAARWLLSAYTIYLCIFYAFQSLSQQNRYVIHLLVNILSISWLLPNDISRKRTFWAQKSNKTVKCLVSAVITCSFRFVFLST